MSNLKIRYERYLEPETETIAGASPIPACAYCGALKA
jgi:hypothetical protein